MAEAERKRERRIVTIFNVLCGIVKYASDPFQYALESTGVDSGSSAVQHMEA